MKTLPIPPPPLSAEFYLVSELMKESKVGLDEASDAGERAARKHGSAFAALQALFPAVAAKWEQYWREYRRTLQAARRAGALNVSQSSPRRSLPVRS